MTTGPNSFNLIEEVSAQVGDYSYRQKVDPRLKEELTDYFLDSMLELRSILNEETKVLQKIIERVEKITWIDLELDEKVLKKLNGLIAKLKDLHSTLSRHVAVLKPFREKGIEKTAINDFKLEVEAIKELYQDIESKYFYLPEIEDFREAEKIISLL